MAAEIIRNAFCVASRRRLRDRICRKLERFEWLRASGKRELARAVCDEMGKAIFMESGLAYERGTVPPQLRTAPWLHVIGELVREFPGEWWADEESLSTTVEGYLSRSQQPAPMVAGCER
ncbi:MAG: hypothetical protein NTW87_09885 [Planctomycetota bacterium]|nr:hypothetical protein [Planctomycetota bacterium]